MIQKWLIIELGIRFGSLAGKEKGREGETVRNKDRDIDTRARHLTETGTAEERVSEIHGRRRKDRDR